MISEANTSTKLDSNSKLTKTNEYQSEKSENYQKKKAMIVLD